MINYTQNEIDIKKIIINYKIENNKIKVKYADISKEEKIYNYSKEKELEIKDTIKKQLNNYDIVKKILKNKIKNSSIWIIILGLIIFFNINMLINSYANIVAWISLFLMGISTYINVTNMKEYISNLNDLTKNKINLENMDTITTKKENVNNYSLNSSINNNLQMINNYGKESKIKKLILKKK